MLPLQFSALPRLRECSPAFPFGTHASICKQTLGIFEASNYTFSLGPTDPCPTAVDTETFSTSAFNVLHLNIRYYNQDLHSVASSTRGLTPTTLSRHGSRTPTRCTHGFSIPKRGRLWVDSLERSSIFRDRFIRQVSCYTLIIGCRLPWPPSCCLDEPTPFVGSDERPLV